MIIRTIIINNQQYERRLKKDKYHLVILNKKFKKKTINNFTTDYSQWKLMSLKENSADSRDGNFLTGKIRAKIVTSATNLNTFLENVFKTSTKINHHYTTLTIKLLR